LAFGHEMIDAWDEEVLELAQLLHELPDEQRDTVRNLVKQLRQK